MIKTLFAAAALSIASFAMANAATVTSTNVDNATLSVLSSTSIALPGGAAFTSLPGSPTTVQGSTPVARSPFEALPVFSNISYFNVTANNTAVLELSSLRTSFSFLWGSVDTYNTLRLVNTAANTMIDIISTALGNPDAPTIGRGASYVTVSGFSFDRVEFISTGNSMEFSNIAAVPLPAGGLLLIGALGGLAALRRRKALAA